MAFTSVPNNPANQLLPYYADLTNQLTELTTQCDPLNGNYFVATGRDLVTFLALPATSAPVWVSTTTYTEGQVVLYSSIAYIAIANASPNLAQIPASSPTFWALYTSSTITVYSAPDSCTGRTANIDDYPVPVFDSSLSVVEFLVLPASVFTQASGQVQFLASSNLVYVYVRSL
jgi:hypothetical protein